MWSLPSTHKKNFKVHHWVGYLPSEYQDCSRKALRDSPSAAKVSKASFWPKVNTPESTLAWLNMDEPLIALWPQRPLVLWPSLSLLACSRYCSHILTHGRRCVSTCTPPCICRGALLHMREAAEGYLCFLIFFIVFDVLSWSSRSRSRIISQMDTSDLLKNMSYHCLFHAQRKDCHCSSTLFTS